MTSISVVIPCYNYGLFLDDAVTSVLTLQEGVEVRVLIIDDASSDDSADVARRIAVRDSRVEVAVHASNAGIIATCNEGIEWAQGDYCILLSADDMVTPGSLRRAKDLLDDYPGVGFVYGYAQRFQHGAPLPQARTRVRGRSVWPGQWWLEQRFRKPHNGIRSPEVVMRTSLLKQVGGADPRLPHTADMEMWLRLAANADVGYLRGVDQAYYRTHGQNMSLSINLSMDLPQRRLAYEAVLERYADSLLDVGRLSDLVHRKLSWEALWAAARAYDRGRTDQTPVEELVTFALDCWPGASRLPVYRALQLRKRIGPGLMPYLQPFIVSAVIHKAQLLWWRRSWKWRGF